MTSSQVLDEELFAAYCQSKAILTKDLKVLYWDLNSKFYIRAGTHGKTLVVSRKHMVKVLRHESTFCIHVSVVIVRLGETNSQQFTDFKTRELRQSVNLSPCVQVNCSQAS